MTRKIDAQLRAQLRELAAQGKTIEQLAEQFGVSIGTVRLYANLSGSLAGHQSRRPRWFRFRGLERS